MNALLILFCLSLSAQAQESNGAADRAAEAQELYAKNQWPGIAQSAAPAADGPAELDLNRGLALAHLGKLEEAKACFESGLLKSPRDKRFLIELAGVAFQQKDSSRAKHFLKRALELDPHDAYVLDFLATLYFLDGNLEAALQYWNRIGKPEIANVRLEPQPEIRAALLDRAFAFSPLAVLRLEDLRTSEARVQNLEVFPRFQFVLNPSGEDKYEVTFRGAERNGWGDGKLDALVSLLRGLPYETLYPQYANLGHSAINLDGLARWDDQKRRLFAEFATPLRGDPSWRLRFFFDGRNENWDMRGTFHAATSGMPGLNLEKEEAGFEIRRVESGRWTWQTGASFAHRNFRNVTGVAPAGQALFTNGLSLEYRGKVDYRLMENAVKRMRLDSSVGAQVGRMFARPLGNFAKVQGSLAWHWFPRATGEDYEMTSRFRAGSILGSAPFDEIYMLGLERDNDLWLRGTVGTEKGMKGSAPMGRRYVLWNWEGDKVIYRQAFFTIRAGPFVDVGRITDPSGNFASSGWRWDPGIECKVRVLGSVEVVFFFGRDLRAGRNAFYATALQ